MRSLKLIALYNIGKGTLLLLVGASLIFLNSREKWLDAISNWASDEILLDHSHFFNAVLTSLQSVVEGEALVVTGIIALVYATILYVQGIGVYLQQRWAEYLMVFATAALIPLEVRHIWHRPGIAGVAILVVNCYIVWFLYSLLRRGPAMEKEIPSPQETPVEMR